MMWRSQQGFALMLVIWVLAVLMVVVLSFSFATRGETIATLAFRDAVQERSLAESCMERAFAEVLLGRISGIPADEDSRAWSTDGTRYRIDMGEEGSCQAMIVAEDGKVDINKSPDVILKGLLAALGLQQDEADALADSIADWRDADNLVRLSGAEDEYYQSLAVPYLPKNADFESVEELLAVRGMSTELLYGNGNRPPLADMVTVHSGNGKINVSAAPRPVLMALPGMTGDAADAIISLRRVKQSITLKDIEEALGALYPAISAYITDEPSNIFAIDTVGRKLDQRAGYAIRAVVMHSGVRPSVLYYRSPWEKRIWKQETSSVY